MVLELENVGGARAKEIRGRATITPALLRGHVNEPEDNRRWLRHFSQFMYALTYIYVLCARGSVHAEAFNFQVEVQAHFDAQTAYTYLCAEKGCNKMAPNAGQEMALPLYWV